MSIRNKVGTIAGTMAVSLAFLPGTASAHSLSFNQKAASYVKQFVGRVPYRYGGASPSTGFDCSGLTSYAIPPLRQIDPADRGRPVPALPPRERKPRVGRRPRVLPRELQPEQLRHPCGCLRRWPPHGRGHPSRRRDPLADHLLTQCDVRHDHPLASGRGRAPRAARRPGRQGPRRSGLAVSAAARRPRSRSPNSHRVRHGRRVASS